MQFPNHYPKPLISVENGVHFHIDADGKEVNKVWKCLEDGPFHDYLDKLLDIHFEGRYTHDDEEKEKTLKKEGRESHFEVNSLIRKVHLLLLFNVFCSRVGLPSSSCPDSSFQISRA
jgi:hypothetical protein